jgi:tetratricopeptide (TPR) repeat protein
LKNREFELSVAFAEAEMALAESLGQRGESLRSLMHGLQALGRLKEAEQHMNLYLLRCDAVSVGRAACLGNLAWVLRDQGRLSEALKTAEEATAIAKIIPEGSMPRTTVFDERDEITGLTFLDGCHLTEASIL